MNFAVIVFPGSNCDHDAYFALKKIMQVKVDFIWHKEKNLNKYDVILLPGGFSYGDYLRSGAIARFSPIMNEVINQSKKGKIIIGICNGFQILIECGLLPGALLINKNVRFISRNVTLKIKNSSSIFTCGIDKKQLLSMPIAHKQGNYFANEELLKSITDNIQIAFTYSLHDQSNLNGSKLNIAGILNKNKNILGMMPHPERAMEAVLGSEDGKYIFKSIIDSLN